MTLKGVSLIYSVAGTEGPWVALTLGVHRPLSGAETLAGMSS
jgi:hypothetical protein